MKKGTNVVCKNCGTEYVWGKKRKLSGGQNIAFYLCYFFMILLAVILGQWMFYSLIYLEFGLFIIALSKQKSLPLTTILFFERSSTNLTA